MSAEACRVSVITPVFNSAGTLPRAASSALGQSLGDIELLIVDDGSHDESLAVARGIAQADSRVRVITVPENRGKPHAMNRAIQEARGHWIAVLDADDCYRPERLAMLLTAAEAERADLVADNQLFFDQGAQVVVRSAFAEAQGDRALDKSAFAAGCDPYAEFDLGMLKPIIRASFVRSAGLAYRERAKLSEDFLFLAEFLAAGGRAWLVARPYYVWTQAFGSVSRRWTATGFGAWRYDYASAIAAHAEVRSEMMARGEAQLAALLTRRMQAFRRLHWMAETNRLRAEGASFPAVVASVARHPGIWTELARRAFRAARAQMGPRRDLDRRVADELVPASEAPRGRG